MKQTVAILTALMIALLVVSGFIVTGSMQQSRALLSKEDMVRALQAERDHLRNENERQKREMERNAQLLAQTIEERDALSSQWNDAVLSSQEASDALSHSEDRNREQAQRIAALERRVTELLAEVSRAEEENASAAMAYEQQAMEDAQRIESLTEELDGLLAPMPTRFERTVTR